MNNDALITTSGFFARTPVSVTTNVTDPDKLNKYNSIRNELTNDHFKLTKVGESKTVPYKDITITKTAENAMTKTTSLADGKTKTNNFTIDTDGNLTRKCEAHGNTTTFKYAADGKSILKTKTGPHLPELGHFGKYRNSYILAGLAGASVLGYTLIHHHKKPQNSPEKPAV